MCKKSAISCICEFQYLYTTMRNARLQQIANNFSLKIIIIVVSLSFSTGFITECDNKDSYLSEFSNIVFQHQIHTSEFVN